MKLDIEAGGIGKVSGILLRPAKAWAMYVLAHGAGAGMQHRLMEAIAEALSGQGIATLRYQFPYFEAGRRRPDPAPVLEATVRAAVAAAEEIAPGLPLVAGGKSMGGRMTSGAAADQPLPGVDGLVFLGFPLHSPGRPTVRRADHLRQVQLPMLFLQGTRDPLAELDLITTVCRELGPRATLHVVEGGDHSFAVLKRSGRTEKEVLEEMTRTIADWCRQLIGSRKPRQ